MFVRREKWSIPYLDLFHPIALIAWECLQVTNLNLEIVQPQSQSLASGIEVIFHIDGVSQTTDNGSCRLHKFVPALVYILYLFLESTSSVGTAFTSQFSVLPIEIFQLGDVGMYFSLECLLGKRINNKNTWCD